MEPTKMLWELIVKSQRSTKSLHRELDHVAKVTDLLINFVLPSKDDVILQSLS